ncbi:hypothetical protein FJY71_06015 [candidate division WOR-3 bacterium]|nr:hypothetical protein [candidate division WOR-3 bacterium]
MRRVLVALALGAAVAQGYVRAYSVEPKTANWSGWTQGEDGYVSQIVTCNFDTLKYVELFAGARGAGGAYTATVLEGGAPLMWSNGTQSQSESWVKFENWNTSIAFTKGKQYEFRFTRGGSDSIQFYYDANDPYHYGQIEIGGGACTTPTRT